MGQQQQQQQRQGMWVMPAQAGLWCRGAVLLVRWLTSCGAAGGGSSQVSAMLPAMAHLLLVIMQAGR